MEGKDSGKKSEDSQSSNSQVSGEDLTKLISYLQELQVKGASTQASSSGGFSLSPIAKVRTGSQDLRKPGTKVLSENSVKYWTALGGPRKIRELRKETGVTATLCRARGIVDAKDLVTGDKAVVLRNAGSRYQVEVEDFTTGNTLPAFSLIFTEFESEGFFFHTTWQWEVGTWRERASSVWDMLTLEMLDWEVPSTIYAKERKGTHEAWRFFE
jgi:hemin uptake protein HemP